MYILLNIFDLEKNQILYWILFVMFQNQNKEFQDYLEIQCHLFVLVVYLFQVILHVLDNIFFLSFLEDLCYILFFYNHLHQHIFRDYDVLLLFLLSLFWFYLFIRNPYFSFVMVPLLLLFFIFINNFSIPMHIGFYFSFH